MILGLVAAKDNSTRFPGKNKHIYKGIPLFWHSVQPLLDCSEVDDVYVITDSPLIKGFCRVKGVGVIWRPKNASRDEDKLINILRFGYYSLDTEYDITVGIMANCPGHQSESISQAISLMKSQNLREVRSFNSRGEESGVLVLSSVVMHDNMDISYYIGSVTSNVKEIHMMEDLV